MHGQSKEQILLQVMLSLVLTHCRAVRPILSTQTVAPRDTKQFIMGAGCGDEEFLTPRLVISGGNIKCLHCRFWYRSGDSAVIIAERLQGKKLLKYQINLGLRSKLCGWA